MKTSTFVLLALAAVVIAYLAGRHLERLTLVQSEVDKSASRGS